LKNYVNAVTESKTRMNFVSSGSNVFTHFHVHKHTQTDFIYAEI